MRILLWLALTVVVVVIVVGSLVSGLTHWPRDFSPALAHFSAYTLLGVLITLTLEPYRRAPWRALVITVLIGVAVELLQITVPVRAFSMIDLGMNAIGAMSGVTLAFLARRLYKSVRADC